MKNRSGELIQKYLLATATEVEVRELESRLERDVELQHEFLLQAEIDTHLRQEAQSIDHVDAWVSHQFNCESGIYGNQSSLWKWVSGISALTAVILLTLFLLEFLHGRQAMAAPSLGKLLNSVSLTEQSIWVAAINGDLPTIEAELQHGVAVDARTEEAYTPLQLAAVFGQKGAVELLLSHSADVSLADNDGNTSLHMAVFLGHTDVVRALLAHGADPLARNAAGFSSIDCAGAPWSKDYEAHLRVAEAEMKTPLDINRIRGERLTILKLLVESERMSVRASRPTCILNAAIAGDAQAIRECMADENTFIKTNQVGGKTPLMLATAFGNPGQVILLIRAGASPATRELFGQWSKKTGDRQ